MAVPKAMQEKYDEIAPLIAQFCADHLNEEYQAICLRLLEKLCRKRPSPLLKGKAKTWAAGIVYEITTLNFIFDRSNPLYMTADELAAPFGIAKSTAGNKAAEIRKLVKTSRMDAEWMLPSFFRENGLMWLISVDGYIVDARQMPREVQQIAFEKGLIPYLPEEAEGGRKIVSLVDPSEWE